MKKYRIIFAGTASSSLFFLKSLLINKDIEISSVITKPDTPQGRNLKLQPSPIKEFSINNSLKIFDSTELKKESFIYNLKTINPDLLLVANFAGIIPSTIIKLFPNKIICFHPSLLPQYRGSSPIQTALLNGDKQTGITFFIIDEKIDHGPIIYQQKINILENETADQLENKTFELGATKSASLILKYLNKEIVPTPQINNDASYTRKVAREDGYIKEDEDPLTIWRKYKAYYPWPGIWTMWQEKRIKFIELDYNQQKNQIFIKKLQLEGKKITSLEEFQRGYPEFNLFQD